MRMRSIGIGLVAVWLSSLALPMAVAQEWPGRRGAAPGDRGNWGGRDQGPGSRGFERFGARMWTEQAVLSRAATQRLWQQQGWTSEPDQFALQLRLRMASVPPWNPPGRMQAAAQMFQERYGLDETQTQELQRSLFRAGFEAMREHAPQMREYFEQRQRSANAGNGLDDPPRLEERVRMMWPLQEDAILAIEQQAQAYAQTLGPEQRQIAQQDQAASQQRRQVLAGLIDRAQAGQWRPQDWGVTPEMLDPAWLQAEMRRDPRAYAAFRQPGGGGPPERWGGANLSEEQRDRQREEWRQRMRQRQDSGEVASGEPGPRGRADGRMRGRQRSQQPAAATSPAAGDAWTLYVEQFIARYRLEPAQQTTAWAILKDMQAQAASYMASRRADFARLDAPAETPEAQASRQTERQALYAPIEALFEELKTRLQVLPSDSQRAAAGEAGPRATDASAPATRPADRPG